MGVSCYGGSNMYVRIEKFYIELWIGPCCSAKCASTKLYNILILNDRWSMLIDWSTIINSPDPKVVSTRSLSYAGFRHKVPLTCQCAILNQSYLIPYLGNEVMFSPGPWVEAQAPKVESTCHGNFRKYWFCKFPLLQSTSPYRLRHPRPLLRRWPHSDNYFAFSKKVLRKSSSSSFFAWVLLLTSRNIFAIVKVIINSTGSVTYLLFTIHVHSLRMWNS